MAMYPVKVEHLPLIRAKLEELLVMSPAKQMKWADMDTACRYIIEAGRARKAWLVHGFLVLFDVGGDWYSDKQYLIEQLILRIYPSDASVSEAIEFLELMAQEHDCVAIAAGDTQIGLMVERYKAAGYSVIGTQLYKEVDRGIPT